MDLHDEDERDIVEIVRQAGYPLETHRNIQTEDGYLLTLHRIRLGNHRKHPVVLMHCLLACSGHFVLQGARSLPFLLADAEYDVWLPNVRGVSLSRGHISLDAEKDADYWKFSFHEMGVYDVPAIIDYILSVTGAPQLHYVGFSLGSIILFITCSERPEYATKVSLFVALSPAVYLGGAQHPWLHILSRLERFWQFLAPCLRVNRLRLELVKRFRNQVANYSVFQLFAKALIFSVIGTTPKKLLPYDYGAKHNLAIYGSETVRDYVPENTTCPVMIFYSDQDWFMSGKSAIVLGEKLSQLVLLKKIESKDFSHLDFLISEEAVEQIYKPIIQQMSLL